MCLVRGYFCTEQTAYCQQCGPTERKSSLADHDQCSVDIQSEVAGGYPENQIVYALHNYGLITTNRNRTAFIDCKPLPVQKNCHPHIYDLILHG